MAISEEKIKNLRNYLNKLYNHLKDDAVLDLFSTKLFTKNRVDDILCCIDANFPKEFLSFAKSHGKKQVKSYEYYLELIKIIKKPFFIKDYYRVSHRQAMKMIEVILSYINQDIRYIETNG